MKEAVITQRKRTEQTENKFMERLAFQGHLPSKQDAEEESRMKKKEISIAFLVLGSFNQSEETSGLPLVPFQRDKEERGRRQSIHARTHTHRQLEPQLN